MEDTRNKKLLSILKDGDQVLCVLEGNGTSAKQIVKLKNVEFSPPNEEHKFTWLNFEVEVLYTNVRLHSSEINRKFTNCFGIREKIPNGLEELIAKRENLWKFGEYQLTDEEFEN